MFSSWLHGQEVDKTIVSKHLKYIIEDCPDRNFANTKSLNKCAEYIFNVFAKYGDSTVYQEFYADDSLYRNVITSFGPKNAERIIIGAHYDVCGNQDGADDNASGTVGLLELARLLSESTNLNKRIDLVAYTLEEPPFFRTEFMGSYVHANYLKENNIPVYGMICLEMIGYFNDTKGSQRYPLGVLKLFYGSRGDYITCVRRFSGGKMARMFKHKFNNKKLIRTKSFTGPANLTGIDFSDHLNYWHFDYSAVMITNTGFFRNQNYHEETDKIETLDIDRMSAVILQTYQTVLQIAK
jgi:hypothetical protein